MKTSIILAAIAAIPLASYGWTRTYGYEDYDDYAYCIQPTDDGNYIMAGVTQGVLGWLLKTDEYGDTLWTKTYGGLFRCVQQASDGGFILVGGFEDDLCLLKTDASGDSIWSKTYGEEAGDWGRWISQTSDGGYITVGYKDEDLPNPYEQDLWLLKIDSVGDTLWTKSYGGNDIEASGSSVYETSDGGYIISGIARTTESEKLWLIKTDSNGDSLWSKKFGESISLLSGPYAEQTSDDGYAIVGSLEKVPGGFDISLIKTDSSGNTLWRRSWESQGDFSLDIGSSFDETTDGGYIISGIKDWDYPTGEIWLIKTDSIGDTLWTYEYGEEYLEGGYSVHQAEDGGYIICGERDRGGPGGGDLWLLKTNEYGDTVWYEGEPREVLYPQEGDTIASMTPTAWFKNSGTYPIEDFYCHCEITSNTWHTPDYHVEYWVSYPLDPDDSVLVEFSPWYCDDNDTYQARFYTSKEEEPIWQTREKSVTFYGKPFVGISENPEVREPSWKLISTCSPELKLEYSGFSGGFSAEIYDASGRRIDVIKSVSPTGTITWGENQTAGVYFIRVRSGLSEGIETTKRMVLIP